MDVKKSFDIFFIELSEKLGVDIDDIKNGCEELGQTFSENLAKKLNVPFAELERVSFQLLHSESEKYYAIEDLQKYNFVCPCYNLSYELTIFVNNDATKIHEGPIYCPTCGTKIATLDHPNESITDYPSFTKAKKDD